RLPCHPPPSLSSPAFLVIPAPAGIHVDLLGSSPRPSLSSPRQRGSSTMATFVEWSRVYWIPAGAGMTDQTAGMTIKGTCGDHQGRA
ncbi:MAG: hypothetical protein WD031_03160, partial [Gemmatimonadota bacterium]